MPNNDVNGRIEKYLNAVTPHIGIDQINSKYDENLFKDLLNFVVDLNPDQLSDRQLEQMVSMMDRIETTPSDELEESKITKEFYKRNKKRIKVLKDEFLRLKR